LLSTTNLKNLDHPMMMIFCPSKKIIKNIKNYKIWLASKVWYRDHIERSWSIIFYLKFKIKVTHEYICTI
jgi:hypothetical protein